MKLSPLRASIKAFAAALALLAASCGPAKEPEQSKDPGAITAEGALGSPLILMGGDRTVYARIRVSTVARPQKERRPVDVALAIDTSGSMEGAAIEEARRAAGKVIDTLHDGDLLAVVLFHSKAETFLPSTELDAEVREKVKKRISQIEARGTTEMAGGLELAIQEVRSRADPKGVNRVVLLGDGIPNRPGNMENMAHSAGFEGIAVTALGLGLDYDETLMGKIARLSGGRFKYIESADKVASFFQEELERLDLVYARRASATFTPGPGVRIDSIVGSEGSPSTVGSVMLGDITRGDTRDIVVRMTVTPRKAGVPVELLDVTIAFDDALENAGRLERHIYLGAHTTDDERAAAKAYDGGVELSAALAEAAATTIQALELSKQGYYVRARELLTKGADAALAQARRTPSPELEKRAAEMKAVASDMPSADRPRPAPSPSPSSNYEFSDDAMPAPMEQMAPDVAKRRKQVHQSAIDAFQ